MISVNEAKQIIRENATTTRVVEIPLNEAAGYVLAVPVYAPIDTPPFNQSAMDGYAFSFAKWDKYSDFTIVGEGKAGDDVTFEVKPLEAVRIFTGAVLPKGADTVVMQEKITTQGESIRIHDEQLIKGCNVRLRASQTKKDETALPENHYLSPSSVSFVAGLGIDKVKVYDYPRVSIIVTGNELIKPGQKRTGGEIYESNSYGLMAALNQIHITPKSVEMVVDDEEKLTEAISRQLDSDIILLTAGVSVGDYDFVVPALEKCGVQKLFHQIKQKPGKPLYFGKRQNALVFGLPGNPASALTCFYEYVTEVISAFIKRKINRDYILTLADSYTKKPDFNYFLKGKCKGNEVAILNNQESYMMNSFALADCLIELEAGKEYFQKGEKVKVRMII